jgi:heme-degrading monooxygenase HmoA
MIARVWRGWTEPGDADEYERFVTEEVFPEAVEDVDDLVDFEVLRRETDDGDVEFVTIARFESRAGVRAFAGEDYERAHVPDRAKELLASYEATADHYEVRS